MKERITHVKRPEVLYVTFAKDSGFRCCSFEEKSEVAAEHPADKYDVVEYIPRPKKRKKRAS